MHAKFRVTAAIAAVFALRLVAAETSAPAPTFHLFAGSDISVRVDGEYRPVVAADEGSFSVRTSQKVENVALRKVTDVQVQSRLRLTNLAAQITEVSAVQSSDAARREQFRAMSDAQGTAGASSVDRDRGYAEFTRAGQVAEYAKIHTYAPHDQDSEKFKQDLANNANMEGNRALQSGLASSTNQLNQASAILNRAVVNNPNPGREVTITPELSRNGAGAAEVKATATTPSAATAPAASTARIVVPKHLVDEGDGNSDRIDVTFDVSSPQPLENAYAVLITDFTVPQRGTNPFRRVVGKKLGALDAKPRKIRIEADNFPPGFVVTKYDVLLYGNGQQVATNLLENSAALSEDDAYQYILSQYLASNKGKTRPPAAVLMAPKSALNLNVADPELQQPVYVTVAANGTVSKIAGDAAGSKDAPATAKGALAHFRFLPALDTGKQTEGRAKLVVADFVK